MAGSLAVEWAKDGIRVNCLSPGYMLTPLTKKLLDADVKLKVCFPSLYFLATPSLHDSCECSEHMGWLDATRTGEQYCLFAITCAILTKIYALLKMGEPEDLKVYG